MSARKDDVVVVLTTAPSHEEAERIGSTLVGEGLAACANVVPGVVSIFRWEGRVQREPETLVLLKTTVGMEPRLRARLVELHPYDVPEALALPVGAGHDAYLRWVVESVEV